MGLYLGLMSGTSVDAVDAALVSIDEQDPHAPPTLVAAHGLAMPPALRARILALCVPGNDEIDRLGALDVELGRLFAQAALELVAQAGVTAAAVTAIGSHGQTVRHRPQGSHPFTLQLGDANVIAELTGITTVADFRRRDIAAGGQGAPLVPAFHNAVFRRAGTGRAVVNIGGMANVTLLPGDPAARVLGFDTGPGNVLLDAWHEQHRGETYDAHGAWGAGGAIKPGLLAQLLAEPYFHLPPPKSTGRELFTPAWLQQALEREGPLPARDVQATLAELTARSIADALRPWQADVAEVFVCGGGAHNRYLCERLAHHVAPARLQSTAALGIHPDWVEAMAFAWLAQRRLAGLPGNLPEVTGARAPVLLGGIYPGRA